MDPFTPHSIVEARHPDTLLAQAGSRWDVRTGGISMPIHLAAAYRHPGLGQSTGWDYTRSGNPTRDALEVLMARLEGGERAFAFGSGMAAVDACLRLLRHGQTLVVPEEIYGGTWRLAERVCLPAGITIRWVSFRDLFDRPSELLAGTDMLLLETPTNPTLLDGDPSPVVQAAREAGAIVVVDSTFLTPVLIRPLEMGADLVIHSGTKYLGGHSDLCAGLVVAKGGDLVDRLAFLQNTTGTALAAFDCWLLLRGLKTLHLRVERQQDSARKLSYLISRFPGVRKVMYPGRGAMIAFEVDSAARVEMLLRSVKIWIFAESLGGCESLVTVPSIQTHADVSPEVRQRLGITDRLVRLSVGVEDVQELADDLAAALGSVEAPI